MSGGLRLALPSGALFDGACELLAQAGVARVDAATFARSLRVSCGGHELLRVRPTDVPVYVEMGAADCGIVGKDVLWESNRDFFELADLRFGHCRLVLAAPEGSPMAAGRWPAEFRVATKYPNASRRYFGRQRVAAELIKLHGSVELAPATGLADAVMDITATGTTLRANQLVELRHADTSTARLVANQASLKVRASAINDLARALRQAADEPRERAS